VIPTYNRATLVGRAVRSVLTNIRPGDEVIVVDDGSTDDTRRALAEFGPPVRVITMPNGGAGRARNRGLVEARHDIIAFLDSDDEWMPDRLELGRELLNARPDILFCFSNFGLRDEYGRERHNGVREWLRREPSWDRDLGPAVRFSDLAGPPAIRADFAVHTGDLYRSLLDSCGVAVQTLLVRRTPSSVNLRFPEDLPMFEDWEYVASLARAGTAAYMDCETAWQWGHGGPRLTDQHADDITASATHIAILERVWGSDPTFIAAHGGALDVALRAERRALARARFARGEIDAARALLRLAGDAPASLRLLSLFPPRAIALIVMLRRALKRIGNRASFRRAR